MEYQSKIKMIMIMVNDDYYYDTIRLECSTHYIKYMIVLHQNDAIENHHGCCCCCCLPHSVSDSIFSEKKMFNNDI